MDDGFDTGPLLRVRRFPIDASRETAFSLEQRAQEEMIQLFQEFCELAESGKPLPRESQNPSKMRYLTQGEFEKLKEIPADADLETVDRYARAFWYPPYECAYIRIGDARVEVIPACAKEEMAILLHAQDLARLRRALSTTISTI
jgi:methionyl-tRNA formyltransferase